MRICKNKRKKYTSFWTCFCPFVSSGGRTLQILKAKVSDGGKYSCVAINAAGQAYKHIYLSVYGQPNKFFSPDFSRFLSVFGFISYTEQIVSSSLPPQFLPVSRATVETCLWRRTFLLENLWPWSVNPPASLLPLSPGTRMAEWWQKQQTYIFRKWNKCFKSNTLRWHKSLLF